jgi:hypothetical protein
MKTHIHAYIFVTVRRTKTSLTNRLLLNTTVFCQIPAHRSAVVYYSVKYRRHFSTLNRDLGTGIML